MHSELYSDSEGYKANIEIESKAKTVYKAFEGMAEVFI